MGMRMDMSLLLLKSNLELMYKKKKQYFALSSSHISLYVHLYRYFLVLLIINFKPLDGPSKIFGPFRKNRALSSKP